MRDTVRELAAACDGDHRPDCPILHDLETGGTIMSSDLQ
jgi:MerR family copper efflux transcriptional regulator